MWYFKTRTWLFQAFMKASMSEGSLFLLCIKMASAPIKIAIRSCLLRYKENTHTYTQKIWRETLELMHLHSGMLRLASKLRPIPSQQWTPLHGQQCKSQDRSGCLYMPFKKIIFKKKYQYNQFILIDKIKKKVTLKSWSTFIFNANSSISANGCARPSCSEFVLGNNLSSKHAPDGKYIKKKPHF